MTKVNLKQYIQFSVVNKAQFPCNLKLEVTLDNEIFNSPGIFFLFYRGELIYIGFTNNNQNVIGERVIRQIATITMRDYRLQFTNAALDALINDPVFDSYFNVPKPIVANTDFVTSVNRVNFASSHWDEFKNFNNETLSRFEMEWYPNPKVIGCISIEEISQQLIEYYKPRCNKEYCKPILNY